MSTFPHLAQVIGRHGRRLLVGLLPLALAGLQCASAAEEGQLGYDKEYPQIGYGKRAPTDAWTRLMARLAKSGDKLPYDTLGRGYLDGILKALDIDPASQVLVFSKSSLKQRFISPETPRSLFFSDDIYVGFVPGSRSLEIAAMDPVQGPVFFDVTQDTKAAAPYKQETDRCLRCHDTYSMTGGGVPRFMLSSVVSGPTGELVSHELSEITEQATPIAERWGGWFVTGLSGKQAHMGNFIVKDVSELKQRPWVGKTNQSDLKAFTDLTAYPRQTSDIVALMVLQHQVEVQNRLVRLGYESRKLLDAQPKPDDSVLQPLVKPVLQVLFFADEPPLADTIEGSSGYKEWFEARGPKTADGKSLRQFDLKTRTFRNRLSYLIYSDAVAALPPPVKSLLYRDIQAVLAGDASLLDGFTLPGDERETIRAILQATKPDVLAAQ